MPSRKNPRTQAQTEILAQAEQLHTLLRQHKIPEGNPDLQVDTAIPHLMHLLKRARAYPTDIGTTQARLVSLHLTLCHNRLRWFIGRLRTYTKPQARFTAATGILAEETLRLSKLQDIDPARVKSSRDEIKALVKAARLKLHNHNLNVAHQHLVFALDMVNDIQCATGRHNIAYTELDVDPEFFTDLNKLATHYTIHEVSGEKSPES